PVIGFLDSGSPAGMTAYLAGFHQGLAETGFTEGKNLAIVHRWGQSRYDQLPALAAELVRLPVAVIVATRGPGPALAAKTASWTPPSRPLRRIKPTRSSCRPTRFSQAGASRSLRWRSATQFPPSSLSASRSRPAA